jgi:hypothetical protein
MKTINIATKQQTTQRRTAPPTNLIAATSTNRQLFRHQDTDNVHDTE